MSLKDKASLIFKPSRYKAGTAYSFRGGDLAFSRTSTATRVNENGYIESVATGVPRLNYDAADLTKEPTLLVERQSTNHFPYSNDFTQGDWFKDKVTIVPNVATSPDGTNNASLMYVNTTGSVAYLYDSLSVGTNSFYTISAYVKSAGKQICWIYINSGVGGGNAYFDLSKKTISISSGSTSTLTAKMTELSDGWFRIEATTGSQTTLNSGSGIGISDSTGSAAATVNGINGIYIYGLQIEPTTGATSLINTSGAAVTRSADYAEQVPTSVIDKPEGTFYIDLRKIKSRGFGTSVPSIVLYKTNTTTGAIGIVENTTTPGQIRFYARISGTQYLIGSAFDPGDEPIKICFLWSSAGVSVYRNGSLYGSIATAFTQTLDSGLLLNASTREIIAEYNEVIVVNQRLSEAEAIALTSFDDYEELVDAKGLTWESSTITNNRLSELAAL